MNASGFFLVVVGVVVIAQVTVGGALERLGVIGGDQGQP